MNMSESDPMEAQESASYQKALRETAKHIIYTYLNARVTNMNYAEKNRKYGYLRPLITSRRIWFRKSVKKPLSFWLLFLNSSG